MIKLIVFIGNMINNECFISSSSYICKCWVKGNLIAFPALDLIVKSHVLKSIALIIVNHWNSVLSVFLWDMDWWFYPL